MRRPMSAPKYQPGIIKSNFRGRYDGQSSLGSNPNFAKNNFDNDPYSQNDVTSTAVGLNNTVSYPGNSNVLIQDAERN